MKTTRYFEEQVLRKRPYIRREWSPRLLPSQPDLCDQSEAPGARSIRSIWHSSGRPRSSHQPGEEISVDIAAGQHRDRDFS
ncbi:MAG: hypothetical protein R3D62_21510, partial [Xanthobacteraceae bacterium]